MLLTNYVNTIVMLGLLLLVSGGLYRYSMNAKFRLWAVGWFLFGVAASLALSRIALDTSLLDIPSIILLSLSALLFIDGKSNRTVMSRRIPAYLVSAVFVILYVSLGILFKIDAAVIYIPFMGLVSYAGFAVFHDLRKMAHQNIIGMICRLGFFLWGVIALLYPLLMYLSYTLLITAAFATVYVMTGTSMMCFYIRLANQGLKAQTEVASLMTQILQHDIRNYVHTANLALQVHQHSGQDSCVDIASDALIEAVSFCEKMRSISTSLVRLEPSLSSINISPLVQSACQRVIRQYDAALDSLILDVPELSVAQTHPLIEELVWNLLDNSFKFSKSIVEIMIDASKNGHVSIIINDNAGGLPQSVQEYLNSDGSTTHELIPGNGLGIAIVKGLTILCGAKLHVSDRIIDSEIVGSCFHLTFQKPTPI